MPVHWTEQGIMNVALKACSGSKWKPLAARRSYVGPHWETMLEHERGDKQFVCFREELPINSQGFDYLTVLFTDASNRPLQWPDFKKGDEKPHYTVELWPEWAGPRPENKVPTNNFNIGQQLTICAIDADAQTLTVVPSTGPWELPQFKEDRSW